MHFNWEIEESSDDPPLESILTKRDLAETYKDKTLDLLPDENLFKDIHIAVKRIFSAIRYDEKIVIFGHDDPDGTTSTYILYNYLKKVGATNLDYYIPNRLVDNHGIQKSFVKFVRKGGYKLIVTVDNGITSFEGVKMLRDLGCDVIITDHHLLKPEGAPHCKAVVNPKQADCEYPFDMPAGVGVALMLVRNIYQYCRNKGIIVEEPNENFYFWTAVGSITDKVPLVGVNRLLIKYVIDNFYKLHDPVIDSLKAEFGMLGSDAKIMEFMTYAGLLIMGGRDINGNHLAMDFLLSQEDETKVILAELLSLKKDNEQDVQAVVKFVDSLIKDYEGNGFIYYDAEDQIPYKLLGYAASHTTTKLMIPALFLKKKDNQILCEGRCGSGFSILEAYSYCSDTLTQFGGHVKAAGFTMIPENLNEFIFQFNGFLQMSDESIKKNMTIKVDTSISLKDLTKDLWNQLQELQPFGMGNPSPIFHLKATKADVEKKGLQIIGIKHHCKIAEIIFHWTEFDKISVIDYH